MKNLVLVLVGVVYGVAAFLLFCETGVFGQLGENRWRDAGLLLVTFTAACALTYISMLLMAYLRRQGNSTGDPLDFEWHLMIPCRDEESVIAATVSAARTSFPHAHVWVIDDASEDQTAAIVRGLMDFDVRVHLISRVAPNARIGKGEALNSAYRIVGEYVGHETDRSRVIVGVLDADGYLSDNALEYMAGPESFGDPGVGAAQLEVWMKNRNDRRPMPGRGRWANLVGRYLVRMQDVEFRTTNSAMQVLRVEAGSVGMGGNGQFTRLDILDALTEKHGNPWGRKLCEDYELGLHILAMGAKNHYVREAHVSQEALPYVRRLLTQRTRWAQGIMECASLLPVLRRSRKMRFAGLLEIHYFMALPLIMVINLLMVPLLTWLAIREHQFNFLSGSTLTMTIVAMLLFLILPYAAWGPIYRKITDEDFGIIASIFIGIGALFYAYFTYFYYPRAIARMLSGRTAWAKTKRNADGITPLAVPALEGLDSLALVNRSVIEELAGELDERNDLALEFVSGFAIMWPTRLARIREAVGAEHFEASRDAIGSIKVSSAMIGAERLEYAAARIGNLIVEDEFDACRRELSRLEEIGAETVQLLRSDFLDEIKGMP
ncbi:cellulose synthase/poly-beta-1,6-N-acetylglucosamine synthase-like glycosyltransferase [Antricoccus suffuscus]|uniref:Cellulose synthase/poly-beta-1,6-N-acetylglucosamine synthase-like glycosyltransferase n=1 Tax=Antricoccus suffuscus TaxID=1629062 RepID=A0A2T1A7A3_9ACTN|nr:glycosyltransferase [Antricoccus suffuscus]PRZ44434.1 cellulose synthase/poly-beta-1,6-N-acetylglucosamine synthase-like glycosyltransferase [Antricoccus suffuscus]